MADNARTIIRCIAWAVVLCVALEGCGGSDRSGGSGSTGNPPPTTTATTPSITTQPASTNVAVGAQASFTIVAMGNGTLTYQWVFNGAPINGATSASLNVTASTTSAGSYACIVTDAI